MRRICLGVVLAMVLGMATAGAVEYTTDDTVTDAYLDPEWTSPDDVIVTGAEVTVNNVSDNKTIGGIVIDASGANSAELVFTGTPTPAGKVLTVDGYVGLIGNTGNTAQAELTLGTGYTLNAVNTILLDNSLLTIGGRLETNSLYLDAMSSGAPDHPTPEGVFHVYAKVPVQSLRGCVGGECYDYPDVRWAIWFYQDYGFHTAYWHDDFGTAVSHGCLNLREADAAAVYDWLSHQDAVNIHV